jgi:hypothetical protein
VSKSLSAYKEQEEAVEEEAEEFDMRTVIVKITKSEKFGEALLVLSWGGGIAAIFANALFQNPYPTVIHYILVFILCVMGGAVMQEVGKALVGFLGAMAVAVTILITLSSAPAFSSLSPQGGAFIQSLMILIILRSTFPIPFVTYLVASMVGALLGDRFLEEPLNFDWTGTAKT